MSLLLVTFCSLDLHPLILGSIFFVLETCLTRATTVHTHRMTKALTGNTDIHVRIHRHTQSLILPGHICNQSGK